VKQNCKKPFKILKNSWEAVKFPTKSSVWPYESVI